MEIVSNTSQLNSWSLWNLVFCKWVSYKRTIYLLQIRNLYDRKNIRLSKTPMTEKSIPLSKSLLFCFFFFLSPSKLRHFHRIYDHRVSFYPKSYPWVPHFPKAQLKIWHFRWLCPVISGVFRTWSSI